MKKKIGDLILPISIFLLIVFCVAMMFTFFVVSRSWQKGYTPLEWVNAGIEQLEEDNKLPNYDEYEIYFVDVTREDNCVCFSYKVEFYETQERDYSKDIDLWYMKVTTYTFNICLERSNCCWNKIAYFVSNDKGIIDAKFEKCIDYDVAIKEREQ